MTVTAIRWSGLGLIIGAVLLGIGIIKVSFNPVENQQFPPDVNVLFLIASILLLISFPGMYARQANSTGWLGLAGYILLQAGMVLIVMIASAPLLYPSIKDAPGESIFAFSLGIALTLGLLLTGIAAIRGGAFPLWSGILLILATIGFFFVFFIAEYLPSVGGQVGSAMFGVLLSLAFGWIGLSMCTGPLR